MSADSAVTYTSVHSEARSWKLEDHVPVYIPEHPKDLVPAEDEAPIEAYITEVVSAPTPLLPTPSTRRRANIPKDDTPPRMRLLLTTPGPRCEVGESFAAVTARQPGPNMARRVDCGYVDTVETRVRVTVRRMMAALEVVNLRVSYQVDVRSRESLEFYSRHLL
ncbi:hypothetical protein Tco_1342798, partial [Tanacetum coccineum]